MIEEDGVSDLRSLVGDCGSLDGDRVKEVGMSVQFDQLRLLFDSARDPSAVGANVAEQLGIFTSLKTELTKAFVAGCRLGLAETARKIRIEADEDKVVDCSDRQCGSERGGVIGHQWYEVDLRKVCRGSCYCKAVSR
jgi:hypothetical protein